MFIGLGSVINAITILLGSSIGIFFGSKLKEKTRDLVMACLGLVTACAAADMAKSIWSPEYQRALPKGWPIITILVALILGSLLGSVLRIEERLEKMGDKFRNFLGAKENSRFIEGFVLALSLIHI